MRLAAFILLGAGCTASCTTIAPTPSSPTVELVRLEERAGERSTAIVGLFVLRNRSDNHLCVMRDILDNALSPHIAVPKKIGRSRFIYGRGVPHPPKTTGIVSLSPGEAITFERVVVYVPPEEHSPLVQLRVETRAWWCEGDSSFVLRTAPFSPFASRSRE